MTQEHREMWLATLGWSRTDRGHVRKHWWHDDPTETTSHWITHMTHAPVKFRRFPFGRRPKHDAPVGWFDLGDELLNRGGLRELNEMANKTGAYKDVSDGKPDTRVEVTWSPGDYYVSFPANPYGNKRRGWDKNGEVMG